MEKYILPFNLTKQENLLIKKRLEEFQEIKKADCDSWFSELCFCILTAQAQAQKAIKIQQQLGIEGFLYYSEEKIRSVIRSNGHRFHNNKSKYIVEARSHRYVKDMVSNKNGFEAREYLAENIKGLGYKEASHFLRNVGYNDVAIIDRHILRFLNQYNFIQKIPKTITNSKYIEMENVLKNFDLPLDQLDLTIWCHMTGKVLK